MTNPAFFTKIIYMALLFCLYQPLFAGPTVSQLLSSDILLTEQTILLEQDNGLSTSIARARIHFLTSKDCQSGYADFYDTFNPDNGFAISIGKPFGLSAASTYQAGLAILGEQQIEQIHSILIRLLSNKGQFAWFTGVCNDQGVNCCVPVDCSNQTGNCLASHGFDTQLFTL